MSQLSGGQAARASLAALLLSRFDVVLLDEPTNDLDFDGLDRLEGFLANQYKPGDVMRPPRWNIPYQPRLDWQMWFAALGTPAQNPWFERFLQRLLENSPEVTALLASNPFAFPHKPPIYVRALLYDYRFSSREEKDKTGAWWVRQPEGIYYPAVTLGP